MDFFRYGLVPLPDQVEKVEKIVAATQVNTWTFLIDGWHALDVQSRHHNKVLYELHTLLCWHVFFSPRSASVRGKTRVSGREMMTTESRRTSPLTSTTRTSTTHFQFLTWSPFLSWKVDLWQLTPENKQLWPLVCWLWLLSYGKEKKWRYWS